MVANRGQQTLVQTATQLHQGKDVDYTTGAKVAEQLWTFVKLRLDLVLRSEAIVNKMHGWFKLPEESALKRFDTTSLASFANSLEAALSPGGGGAAPMGPCDDNIDEDPSQESGPTPNVSAALAMAKLIEDVPQGVDPGSYSIEPIGEQTDELFEVALPHVPSPGAEATRKNVCEAFKNFVMPKSFHDMVESAIKLCGYAMHSKTVSASLPDRSHCSIEQRWMTIDRTLGPTIGYDGEVVPVGRYDVVKYRGSFWRIIATFAKYYGRWACTGEPVPLTEQHKLMLQALVVSHAEHPYVKDNFGANPFLVMAMGNHCTDMKYGLIKEEEYRYKKMKRKGEDLWVGV